MRNKHRSKGRKAVRHSHNPDALAGELRRQTGRIERLLAEWRGAVNANLEAFAERLGLKIDAIQADIETIAREMARWDGNR